MQVGFTNFYSTTKSPIYWLLWMHYVSVNPLWCGVDLPFYQGSFAAADIQICKFIWLNSSRNFYYKCFCFILSVKTLWVVLKLESDATFKRESALFLWSNVHAKFVFNIFILLKLLHLRAFYCPYKWLIKMFT